MTGGRRGDGLDPKFWGSPPTCWQRLTAQVWQSWLRRIKRAEKEQR